MNKRKYLELCKQQSAAWLKQCAENPSLRMTKMHVALVLIALRHATK